MNDKARPPTAGGRRCREIGLYGLLAVIVCVAGLFLARKYARVPDGTFTPDDAARAIRSGPPTDRLVAMDSLWQFPAEEARVAVPALLAALKDRDASLRAKAATSLPYVLQSGDDRDEERASEALVAALSDRDAAVRASAATSLGAIYREASQAGGAPPEVGSALVVATADPDASVREAALAAIAAGIADPRVALDRLLKAAKDPSESVQAAAVRWLVPRAKDSPAACLIVIRALNDSSPLVRKEAEFRLIGPNVAIPEETIPDLILALHDRPSGRIPSAALHYLERVGPAAKGAIPAILSHARRYDPERVNFHAARALGAIAPGSAEARALIPPLIAQLRDGSNVERFSAAEALGAFTWDREVVAALRRALQDHDPYVARRADEALRSLPASEGPSSSHGPDDRRE